MRGVSWLAENDCCMELVVSLHSLIRVHGAVGNEAPRLPDLLRLLSETVANIK